jgi:ATP-binding cassette subfamily A (ABC1) protein 3
MGSYFVNNVNSASKQYDYTAFVNTTGQASSAYYLNRMNQAILRDALSDTKAEIITTIQPFAFTYEEKGQLASINGGMISGYIGIGTAFIPALITQFLVMEVEFNLKHQQIVSGVSIMAYWLANYAMDLAKYFVFAIFAPIILKVFGVDQLTEGENF